MTPARRRAGPFGRPATGLAATLLVIAAIAGCGGGEDLTDSVRPTLTTPQATTAPAGPEATTAAPRLRDGDVLDLDILVAEMTTGTTGDPEWIEVFAPLRAKSWIAARYPGEHDMEEIYSDYLAAEVAIPGQQELLAQNLYLDQPLPRIVSVDESGPVGELTDLEVVIDSGDLTYRSLDDDSVQVTQEGGLSRGLFTVGRDRDGQWRIHSVVELQVVDQPETEEPSS